MRDAGIVTIGINYESMDSGNSFGFVVEETKARCGLDDQAKADSEVDSQ